MATSQIKHKAALIVLITIFNLIHGQDIDCLNEGFGNSSLGIFQSKCDEMTDTFVVKKYADFPDLPKPTGSNDFFLTQTNYTYSYCIKSSIVNVKPESTISVTYYSERFSGPNGEIVLKVVDAENESVSHLVGSLFVGNVPFPMWRTTSFKLKADARKIKITLGYRPVNTVAFVAINSIKIASPNASDCLESA